MLEREVDRTIRRGSCTPQALEVVNGAATDLGPDGRERSGRGIGASQADDLMTRADELGRSQPCHRFSWNSAAPDPVHVSEFSRRSAIHASSDGVRNRRF